MRFSSVIARGGRLVVHSAAKTVTGVVQAEPPFLVLPENATPENLGRALRDALLASREGVENRDNLVDLLAAVGVKSWGALALDSRLVEVVGDESRIRLVPMKNKGPRDGFGMLREGEVHVPNDAEPMEIGRAIRRALARAL